MICLSQPEPATALHRYHPGTGKNRDPACARADACTHATQRQPSHRTNAHCVASALWKCVLAAHMPGMRPHLGRSEATLGPRMLYSMSHSACWKLLLRTGAMFFLFTGLARSRKSLAASTCTSKHALRGLCVPRTTSLLAPGSPYPFQCSRICCV